MLCHHQFGQLSLRAENETDLQQPAPCEHCWIHVDLSLPELLIRNAAGVHHIVCNSLMLVYTVTISELVHHILQR